MKNTDKVTLTVGQLKKLIKESFEDDFEKEADTIPVEWWWKSKINSILSK